MLKVEGCDMKKPCRLLWWAANMITITISVTALMIEDGAVGTGASTLMKRNCTWIVLLAPHLKDPSDCDILDHIEARKRNCALYQRDSRVPCQSMWQDLKFHHSVFVSASFWHNLYDGYTSRLETRRQILWAVKIGLEVLKFPSQLTPSVMSHAGIPSTPEQYSFF